MNCFLIDYENVNASGLSGISGLSAKDKVVIFYSDRAETMTFGLHRRLNESKADISFQKVRTGSKNALDLQLCTYLGYLIAQNGRASAAYYIVSGDQDYAVVTEYWDRQNINVALIPEIAVISVPVPAKKALKKKAASIGEIKSRLKALLPGKYQNQIPVIAEIIHASETKQKVHGELVRAFHDGADNSVPSEIYKYIKPLLSDKL